MAPSSGKRKRPDRQYPQDDAGRPSPHRPETLTMANHGGQHSPRGPSRGGRGSRRGGAHMAYTSQSHNSSPAPHQAHTEQTEQSAQNPSETPSQKTSQPVPIPQPPVFVQPELMDDEPSEPPAIYYYEYLTDEVVGSWKESGRQALLDSIEQPDYFIVSILVQELVRAALDKRIESTDAGKFVEELARKDFCDVDVLSLFIDTISLLDEKDQKRKTLAMIAYHTGIGPDRFRLELDVQLLQHLGLVRTTFDRMRTRKTTNVLYRQANFNLLREESEGYAKMLTDYYNATVEANTPGSDPDMAEDVFEHMMAFIGAFDLDVGRVLDITLDISANMLVKAYRLFVKVYRCSSWWPENTVDKIQFTQDGPGNLPSWALPGSRKWQFDQADKDQVAQSQTQRDVNFWNQVRSEGINAFFELGCRKIVDYETVLPLLEQEVEVELDPKGRDITADQRKRINENRKYMKATKMLPPQGNPDAAQLLGFKLRFYASPTRDAKDVLPENIMYLAALLIKIGFISLQDLYPHVYPSDEDMEQEKERLEKEKAERDHANRPGGGMNALLTAGALTDDTVPAVRNIRAEAAKSGGTTPKSAEKKVEEQEKLTSPPTNQKIMLLKALLAIGAIPEVLFILGKFPWLIDLEPTLPSFLHRIVHHMLKKIVPARPLQTRDVFGATKLQANDLLSNADGTLRLAPRPRPKMRRHLGIDATDNGEGYEARHYYTDWDDNVPVCQTIDDFFTLCNSFMNLLGVKVGHDTRLMVILIRLARKCMAEDTSQSNYDRWLEFIKRTLLPALSLTPPNPGVTHEMHELLSTLSITTRFRLYEEWFTGRTSRLPDIKSAFDRNRAEVKDVLRRITNESGKKQAKALAKVAFSSPGIVMMTFINQLENYSNMIPGLVDSVHYFNPLAFDVLTWVLIKSLSGQGRDRMQGDGMLTSAWLQALSRFVASLFTRYSGVKLSPVLQYVASELRQGDSTNLELIDQVIAEMAGIKSEMTFNDAQLAAMTGGAELQSATIQQLADIRHRRKSSGKRLMKALSAPRITGQILVSIAQETQMYSHRENSKYMPLKVLGNNMDKIHQVLAQYLDMMSSSLQPAEFEAVVPDVIELIGSFGLQPVMAFAINRHVILHRKAEVDSAKKKEITDTDVVMQDANQPEPTNGDVTMLDSNAPPWHPLLEAIANRLPAVTGDLSTRVNIHFFTTFWTLSPQDINCPLNSYVTECARVEQQRTELTKDRSDSSATATKEREKKVAALDERKKLLLAEQRDRLTAVSEVRGWLSTQKKHWFESNGDEAQKATQHLNLLQDCFLPRALHSALDANYCSTLLKILHSNNTPGFSLWSFLDQLLRKPVLSAIIFQCTTREADNFGRFLCELLKHMSHWHGGRKTYEHEAFGAKRDHTGFATELDESGKPAAWLDYEDFRRILFGWHNSIKDAFKVCFESGEFMQIRNGIIVLKCIHSVFPALKFHGKAMQDAIKAIADNDSRSDLKLAARSFQGLIKSREAKWVIPQDFKMSEVKEQTSTTDQTNGDIDMADANNEADNKLNASASAFKPEVPAATNGNPTAATAAEDGEIEDESSQKDKDLDIKMPDAPVPTTKVDDSNTQQNDTKPAEPVKEDQTNARSSKIPKRNGEAVDTGGRTPLSQAAARPNASQPNGRSSNRPEEQYGRLDRPSDMRPPLSRSRSPVSRTREREVLRSADPAGEHDRIRRETRPPLKPVDTRPFRDDSRGRTPRHVDTRDAPPSNTSASAPHPDRAVQQRLEPGRPNLNGSGASQMTSVVSQPSVNPQRAALINGDSGSREERERRREYQNTRHTQDSRASGRLHPADDLRSDVAPTGPRAGRSGGSRDLFEQPSGRGNPSESGRNRLSRDGNNTATQAESSYGRLNGGSDSSPPTRPPNGPGRGQRTVEVNDPSLSSRASELKPEPAATRNPRQRPAAGDRPSTNPLNADRTPATPASGAAIHPSRLANLDATPTIDSNAPQGGSAPPSGPRAQGRHPPSTPTGPSPTNILPTGPSHGGERQRRNERPRIQAPSQPAVSTPNGSQGTQFRGAARQNSHNGAPPEPPTAVASSMEAPPRAEPPVRVDPGRQEMIQRGQKDNERGDRQRSSRHSSRDRRPDNGRPGYNEHRDERGPRDAIPREKRGREDEGPPLRPLPTGAYPQPGQDWNRGPQRGGYDDRARDGGYPRGGADDFRAPRRPDEGRRDEQVSGQEHNPRKRRSMDDGPPFEAKRRRSGR